MPIVFTEKNTDFGTIHATANVSYDNAVAANICGVGVVSADTDTIDIENNLTARLGLSVTIDHKEKKRGSIKIENK